MYEVFFIATATVLIISCICSLLEAVLYAIPASQIEIMASQGHKTGIILKRLYEDIDRPIAAILSLPWLIQVGQWLLALLLSLISTVQGSLLYNKYFSGCSHLFGNHS